LAGRLTAALQRAGLAAPNVSVRRVAALDRHPQTGKAKRFITSPSESVGSCLGPQEADGAGGELVVCRCTTSSGIAFRADLRRLGRPDGHR
jgi:hypothetical protein